MQLLEKHGDIWNQHMSNDRSYTQLKNITSLDCGASEGVGLKEALADNDANKGDRTGLGGDDWLCIEDSNLCKVLSGEGMGQ